VQALMVLAAKRLQLAEPECFHVAVMVLAVVDDVGYDGAAFGFADLAQWMCHEMVAPALAPAASVIRTAAISGALTTAFNVEFGYVVASAVLGHALMLARASGWCKRPCCTWATLTCFAKARWGDRARGAGCGRRGDGAQYPR